MSLDDKVVGELKVIALETRKFDYTMPDYWSGKAKAIELIRPFYKDSPVLWSAYFSLFNTYVSNGVDHQ